MGVRVALAGFALLSATFAASLAVPPYTVTGFAEARDAWRSSDAWLLDRNGVALSRVRIDHDRRRGDWVTLGDVSPALVELVVAAEDRRFRAHAGVDWKAIAPALWQTLAGERRGGSTLTMQLAARLEPRLETSGRRGVIDKWRQVRQALALERRWTKDEILEAWLNLTPFRGELEGVDAASRSLFGKRSAGLDRVESALLAALVRAPNAGAARVAQRACVLLARDESACLATAGYATSGLRPRGDVDDLDGAAPHLARKLLTQPGQRVTSTLDASLQRFAVTTLTRHLRELAGRHVEDGALVVLDNATGEVLAWVGSSGALSRAHEVDGVLSARQAGSTLKPFLYALAIGETRLTAASILDDSPLAVSLPTGLYVPQNYDRTFKGRVSLRQALAASLNVPAVRTLALTGYEPFHRQLRGLGLDLPREADHYGYSLALGGADVTLLQLTNAYRALANGGITTPTFTQVVKESVRHSPTTPTLTLPLKGREQTLLPPQGKGRAGGSPAQTLLPPQGEGRDGGGSSQLLLLPQGQGRYGDGSSQTLLPHQGARRDGGGSSRSLLPHPRESRDGNSSSQTLLPPQGEGRDGGGSKPQAIDPRAAYIVSDILADAAARALTFGLASPLATRYRASVKTGTSKDMRDNWTVGYTTRYTVGVWVGNFSGAPMHDVSGIDGAAPVWRQVMDFLHEGTIPEAAPVPAGLTQQRITYRDHLEPARQEWFLAGTENARVAAIESRTVKPHIASPSSGAIYAIDPDIPRDRQRLVVATRGAPRGARLMLGDGREIRADRPALWLPAPGRREVVLRAADGKELDRVRFEVRGLRPVRKTPPPG